MVTERFTVVALPHSVDPDEPFHVSLFISPQLTPDGPRTRLRAYRHFPHWPDVLKDATFEMRDQIGPIDAKPLLAETKPRVWDAVFPPDTPVRATADLDFASRRWRTFRAGEVHDDAKLLHVAAMYADPTSPPAPSVHPLGQILGRGGGTTHTVAILNVGGEGRRRAWDESEVTAFLDQRIGEGRERISLAALEETIDGMGEDDAFLRLALQVHRARRFYERPESQADYRATPRRNAAHRRPPKPTPDFHERCSLAADHPAVQRRLGLVVDLVAGDPDRLRESQWLSARIVPGGDESACLETKTRCQVAGKDLVTVPRTDDWLNERLRLGNPDLFGLLDMDPDGSALKVDRFLWTVPRLLDVEANGDPVHAAPTALRSSGFTVVRHRKALDTQGRIGNQASLKGQVTGGKAPPLDTEDVTHGLRVEVWDDTAKAWFTLHARRIDARALEHGRILRDVLEEGFIQGTVATEVDGVDDSPVHVHESVFGWEGWSLSAARPGKRVRHENGDEIVEEQDAHVDPATPLIVTSEVEPGTLPRLRYGRSYAFRAWAVNLAGTSRPHAIGPAPEPEDAAVASASVALTSAPPLEPGAFLLPMLRAETAAGILRRRFTVASEPEPVAAAELTALGDPSIQARVLSRLRERRTETVDRGRAAPAVTADRASVVSRAFGDAAVDEAVPFIVDTAVRDATSLAAAGAALELDVEAGPLDAITPLRPFLRWDPVKPPVVVARHGFTPGESLRQLVVRSEVTQDPETLEIHVGSVAAYAADHANFGYRPQSERHLAPSKTSQSEAELHGAFDRAIGSTRHADHVRMLGIALREAGTLFDVEVPRLNDPSHVDAQPGIALEAEPTVPPSTYKELPLPTGEAPAPGQYVVHDTAALRLPYLPDVLAHGVSFVFQEAGRDRIIAFPFGSEGFTARFGGTWPERRPFRLVLRGDGALHGELQGNAIRIGLPPGDVQRFRLASSLREEDLELFGLWRSLPPAVRDDRDVQEAAADGWLWALTPFEEVTLVHAVSRPIEAPRPTVIHAIRTAEGSTDAAVVGAIDLHGPSTEMLTAEARWTDPVDDPGLPAPDRRRTKAIAFTTQIRENEDLAVLYPGADVDVPVPGVGQIRLHSAVHRLGDTRHHTIRYRFRASTRFREYFDPALITPSGPRDDGLSVVGSEVELEVPSSARPSAPIVAGVLPLFRWDAGTEPEQPVATRRRRRAGVRIYLDRPWFSSGKGELLGVLLAPGGHDAALRAPVSQWGADPVWVSAPVARRAMFLELDNLLRIAGLEDRPGDAAPVAGPVVLPLPDGSDVAVLGYEPRFSAERRQWYVDVAIDPGSAFWPFVRLAIARYQPDSIDGCHLSAPIRCDYVQLTPERTTSVSRTDVRHVRVVVSGPIGIRQPPGGGRTIGPAPPATIDAYEAWVRQHRLVVARLQRVDPAIPTDLGWETVATSELRIRGFGRNLFEAAWIGELEAPQNLPLRTPGENPDWRITVEEWERLPGDPADLADPDSGPVWEQRLIYADEISL
jgi:hypothetical protein